MRLLDDGNWDTKIGMDKKYFQCINDDCLLLSNKIKSRIKVIDTIARDNNYISSFSLSQDEVDFLINYFSLLLSPTIIENYSPCMLHMSTYGTL